ncbi:MAG: hypothetical protein FWC89_09970 [Defluviitaleaceae bacterium]|nr:hypothetical protein [Defluviitaleaceae bacterium]
MKISAKYDMLYPPLVERIITEERNKKDPIKAAKTRMHQLYGAYVQGNSHKKAAALLEGEEAKTINEATADTFSAKTVPYSPYEDSANLQGCCEADMALFYRKKYETILNLHASTKERLPYLAELYQFIANHTGEAKTIADLGCGFNPFAIPLMPKELTRNLEAYHAYDIDLRTKELLNRFFALRNLPPTAECADLATETPSPAVDIAFLFKLLPVLEAQSAGRGFTLANSINARFLVITYPLKSLGGREKGMAKNYSAAFETAISNGLLNNFKPITSERIGSELVYILATAKGESSNVF